METDFLKHLRSALNHLYDRDYLRKSPLVNTFGISDRFDSSSVLQRILQDAIETFKPKPGEPIQSERRKVHEILLCRYLQQFNQDEVAHHIGVSERQFRREQERAIDALADYLWQKYSSPPPPASQTPDPKEEWEWLRDNHTERVTNVKNYVQDVIQLMRTVAQQNSVHLEVHLPETAPDLAVQPIALRQMLLNLIQVGIKNAAGGTVRVEAISNPSFMLFKLETSPRGQTEPRPWQDQENSLIEITAQLARLNGGRLEIHKTDNQVSCQLTLPVVDGISVLVIDDHPEMIDLLKRYAIGTRYRVSGINDPEQAFAWIEATAPQIIVMDVMMPKVDGWEMLGRLRSHPQSAHIPVIILTILAQEELALSLGAKALVLKPVTQVTFLSALDVIFASLGSNSPSRPSGS